MVDALYKHKVLLFIQCQGQRASNKVKSFYDGQPLSLALYTFTHLRRHPLVQGVAPQREVRGVVGAADLEGHVLVGRLHAGGRGVEGEREGPAGLVLVLDSEMVWYYGN